MTMPPPTIKSVVMGTIAIFVVVVLTILNGYLQLANRSVEKEIPILQAELTELQDEQHSVNHARDLLRRGQMLDFRLARQLRSLFMQRNGRFNTALCTPNLLDSVPADLLVFSLSGFRNEIFVCSQLPGNNEAVVAIDRYLDRTEAGLQDWTDFSWAEMLPTLLDTREFIVDLEERDFLTFAFDQHRFTGNQLKVNRYIQDGGTKQIGTYDLPASKRRTMTGSATNFFSRTAPRNCFHTAEHSEADQQGQWLNIRFPGVSKIVSNEHGEKEIVVARLKVRKKTGPPVENKNKP